MHQHFFVVFFYCATTGTTLNARTHATKLKPSRAKNSPGGKWRRLTDWLLSFRLHHLPPWRLLPIWHNEEMRKNERDPQRQRASTYNVRYLPKRTHWWELGIFGKRTSATFLLALYLEEQQDQNIAAQYARRYVRTIIGQIEQSNSICKYLSIPYSGSTAPAAAAAFWSEKNIVNSDNSGSESHCSISYTRYVYVQRTLQTVENWNDCDCSIQQRNKTHATYVPSMWVEPTLGSDQENVKNLFSIGNVDHLKNRQDFIMYLRAAHFLDHSLNIFHISREILLKSMN